MADESGEKKIIIDEDWKSQVQAEKEVQASQAAEASDPESSETEPAEQIPPASLASHVMSLASQALMMMGQVPDPETGEAVVHLDYAQYIIDTIEMLEKKTEGNRTPEEISMLSKVLHELRMVYVAVQGQMAAKPSESGIVS